MEIYVWSVEDVVGLKLSPYHLNALSIENRHYTLYVAFQS